MENRRTTDMTKKAGHENIGVNELFQIAMKVERNAANFYKKAADLCDNVRVSELFRRLQSWECEHLSAIDEMYNKLTQQSSDTGKHLPGKIETSEAVLMAGLAVFGIHPDPSDELSGSENCLEAMNLALRKEKDTIVFLNGLKEFITDPEARRDVDLIVDEEIQQIGHLEQARQQLLDAKTANAPGDAERSRKTCIRCGKCACGGNEYDLLSTTQ
jgi:rubrerythrin